MKNSLNKIFSYLNDEQVQTKLKRVNVGVALISFIYIYQLIKKNLISSNFTFQINYLEVVILIIIYLVIGITWVNFQAEIQVL